MTSCFMMLLKGNTHMKYLASLLLLLSTDYSHAHVKWFSDYNFQQAPLQLAQLNNIYFWGLLLLSLVSLPLLVWVDRLGEKSTYYSKMNAFLDQYSENGPLIMRIAMASVLLMSWQGDSIVAPELAVSSPVWGWFQFALALLLLFNKTTPLTGLGIVFLYLLGISQYGFFHMLDYMIYPAVGLYLIFSQLKNERLKNLDLPILYSGLGFSLCWVAFEKIFYPYWGMSVLAQAPALTMGLPHDFFLLSCAFIEFTLGYLLIICLLQRPLAVVITLVFFITTSFFGKTEVIGHTILHGALLVFIVKGHGRHYLAPIRLHKSMLLRNLFAVVNFVVLFVVLAIPYQRMSQEVHAQAMERRAQGAHARYDVPATAPRPVVMVHPSQDATGGWNLHIMTENFRFAPMQSSQEDVNGEGHAHLYVNNSKVARIYGEWFHVNLPKGNHRIKVTLNTNGHKDYYFGGEQVMHELVLEEGRGSVAHHH
jgi:uncharacterized membrane protein YphA (DoxX/SURF4 family)